MEERKRAAKENNNKEAFASISAIIQREHQRDFWRRLNFVTGKKRTRSATTIQVEGQGGGNHGADVTRYGRTRVIQQST